MSKQMKFDYIIPLRRGRLGILGLFNALGVYIVPIMLVLELYLRTCGVLVSGVLGSPVLVSLVPSVGEEAGRNRVMASGSGGRNVLASSWHG